MRRRDLLTFPVRQLAGSADRAAPGSPPGTLPEHSGAAPPRMHVMAYGPAELTEFPLDDLERLPLLRGRFPVLWLNVDGVRHAPTLARVGEIFGLHRVALEDTCEPGQARTHLYDEHIMVVAKMPRRCPELEVEQVSLFVGRDFVISFQEHPGDSLEPVRARLRGSVGRIRRSGPDYLAYALLDAMVDHCFPVIEHYMDALDGVEEELMRRPGRQVMLRLHAIRRDLLNLRRAVYPMRDAVRLLVREPPPGLVAPETLVYLRDVQDQAVQVVDLVELGRELGASLADLNVSFVGNRTNDIVKVLTIFAALFIPLGFVTGVYGMNVDGPPGWLRDLRIAEAGMAAITLALLVFFWTRGWLRGSG